MLLIELADDWHESPFRVKTAWTGDLPEEVKTIAVDDIGSNPVVRVTGRYVRTGTAPDGVPVYAWIPEE